MDICKPIENTSMVAKSTIDPGIGNIREKETSDLLVVTSQGAPFVPAKNIANLDLFAKKFVLVQLIIVKLVK